MPQEYEKPAAPVPPVAADGEQPISQDDENSIAGRTGECNPSPPSLAEIREMLSDPAYLPTITMSQLYENIYSTRPPIIDGLLYRGTYLFAGSSKIGKSFLMAQLAYHVSTGTPLWGYPVQRGTVLYLALEDDYGRLQKRLYRMFGTANADDLHFAICAKQIGSGLEEQLERFVQKHADASMVIIDILPKRDDGDGRDDVSGYGKNTVTTVTTVTAARNPAYGCLSAGFPTSGEKRQNDTARRSSRTSMRFPYCQSEPPRLVV